MKQLLSSITILFFVLIAFGSDESKKTNSTNSSTSTGNSSSGTNQSQRITPCYGTENCISAVRLNFRNTGKQILGEQYLGRGKFGISFLDPNRGEAYNADVSTDCNCIVTNVYVSVMR